MGASSSGLLDEPKISHIKGLVDGTLQSFSVFYRQQYSAAYFGHLHQEVEPKKERRALLLTHRPQYAPEEVLYQGNAKFSCWDEQGKKCKERYIVLRRNYSVEIHENLENFNRGCAAKMVLQSAKGKVFTTEEESKAHLEQTCAWIVNGVKEDSSSVVSSPDSFAVYLHLPYTGYTCFLFQQEEERDHFLSGLKACIRHQNLDHWRSSSFESQAYIQALQLYRQDQGCYESWDLLLGTEEQVLASLVMEEVSPWLQSQLQSRLKGKKTERIRQWLATVQATYTLVLEQLTASLEVLREECRQTASANQALIRSNLHELISSHCFLEEKMRECICEEAETASGEAVAPYLSSILEALTEKISAGIQEMRRTFHTHMDSAFTHTNGGTEETEKAVSTLSSISLDQCYSQVTELTEKLEDLKQRFGLSSTQRLVHSAHLEMEQLLDNAIYTLEQFLQSSVRQQPSHIPVKMERAKERVLKQLDYDSRVVQRRLYLETLLEITLPALAKRMDSKWKTELQRFEQDIFSDYSSFILVHNVYDDILRSILSKEIETAVQDAASKLNNLLLDTSDLAISQYSLLGHTPPYSAPDSPAIRTQESPSAVPGEDKNFVPEAETGDWTVTADVCPQTDPEPNSDDKSDHSTSQSSDKSTVLTSPLIVVTQQFDESTIEEASCVIETSEVQVRNEAPSKTDSDSAESSDTSVADSDAAVTHKAGTPDPPAIPEPTSPISDSPEPSSLSMSQATDEPAECAQSATPESSTSPEQISENASFIQPSYPSPSPSPPPCPESPVKVSLGSLSEAIGCSSTAPLVKQHITDRAVYLTGEIKDNWEAERLKQDKLKEATEKSEGVVGNEENGSEQEKRTDEDEAEENGDHVEKEVEEEAPQSPEPIEVQPESPAELPWDSVAIIRGLVTEITELQMVVSPCTDSSTPDELP